MTRAAAITPTRWVKIADAVEKGWLPHASADAARQAITRHNKEFPPGHPRYISRRPGGYISEAALMAEYSKDAAEHALVETVRR